MRSKSKKAFEHNIKAEIESGKPQPQALAIAYSVKRHPKKKKMAEGGAISASNEKRPMPDAVNNDKAEVSHNSHISAARKGDSMKQDNISNQAQMNEKRGIQKIKHPKMVPQSAYSVRMRDEEDDLMESAAPGPYGEQPSQHMNEEGADRQGPDVPDMEDEHSTHRRPYAKGGQIETSDMHHEANKYEDDLQDLDPSHDEGAQMARSHNEMGPDRQGPAHHEDESHSERSEMFHDDEANMNHEMEMNPAHDMHSADDSEDQPEDEAELIHGSSVAAAVMAKRRKMARGGEILSEDSMESDDSSQADLSRNAQEDANMEDKASFDALRKENYNTSYMDEDQPEDSNLHSDSEESESENKHDKSLVDKIRAGMKKRSIMTR